MKEEDIMEKISPEIKIKELSIYFQKYKLEINNLLYGKEFFSPNLIRIDEKENLQFTKRGIIKYSEYLLY
jgi:hypothetical protein